MATKSSSSIPKRQKTAPKPVKQPFVLPERTKKIIIAAAALVALIVVALIVRYNLQALRVNSEGLIDTNGQNWLVQNVGERNKPRYLKFGQIDPAPGFKLEKTDYISDENEKLFYFYPEDESNPFTYYSSMVAKGKYDEISKSTVQNVISMGGAESEASEVTTTKIADRDVSYYTYTGSSTDQAGEVEYYRKSMNAYVKARGGRSILIMIEQQRLDPDGFLDDQAFVDQLVLAMSTLTID